MLISNKVRPAIMYSPRLPLYSFLYYLDLNKVGTARYLGQTENAKPPQWALST